MPPKGKRTRKSSGDFGAPADLPAAGALPTAKNVISAFNFEFEKSEKQTKSEKEKEAAINITKSVIKKYKDVLVEDWHQTYWRFLLRTIARKH